MKKHFARIFLFAALAMVSLAGCEKDETDDNATNNNGNGNTTTEYSDKVQITVSEQKTEGNVFTCVVHVKMLDNAYETYDARPMYGLANYPVKASAEKNNRAPIAGDGDSRTSEFLYETDNEREFSFSATVMVKSESYARPFVCIAPKGTSNYVYAYGSQFTITPEGGNGNNNDINLDQINFRFTLPELVSSTATTMTVSSVIDLSQEEAEALMKSGVDFNTLRFGFVYVAQRDGNPNLEEALAGNGTPQHIAYCTDDMQTMMNNRGKMTVTFEVMEGASYNVMPFLIVGNKQFTGDWRTLGGGNTGNEGGNDNDEKTAISCIGAESAGASAIRVWVSATGVNENVESIGVCYSKSSPTPTLEDSILKISSAELDHPENFDFIEAFDNGTATIIIRGLELGATYFVRGFIRQYDGSVIYSANAVQAIAE